MKKKVVAPESRKRIGKILKEMKAAKPASKIIPELLATGIANDIGRVSGTIKVPQAEQKRIPVIDLAARGAALVLADLAESLGADVTGIGPDKLEQAGLKAIVSRHVQLEAASLLRNRIDAMLWRNNGHVRQLVDHVQSSRPRTIEQAMPIIEAVVQPAMPKTTNGIEVTSVKIGKPKLPSEPNKAIHARTELWGFAGTSIVRYLGKAGVDFAKAKALLEAQGLTALADSTLKIQLKAGANGQRGEPAKLSKDQIKQLMG